ncbi:NFX1-type zinc finger-containing protein 1 [Desmophyllum pertusum]|uniref:NFX1-type zinc finger-containing protein 1 n=1 Tax=Desmophyllum pertusum TaxID=174260 RepID=A0A9W9ZNN5_9CNID|nr:NFX1-type zinc finger-containing protein 1 [Desmophyllum pertusum]
MVKMKRKLPCEHEATMPCYRNPEEHCCEEEIEIIFSCGHKKLTICSRVRDGIEGETCDTKVTRTLPCGHDKEMQCSDKPGEVFCDAPCDRVLPCEHPCPQKCGDDCTNFKCAVGVQKDLACGSHKVRCLCSDDVSQIVCANKCTRKLPCSHICPGKCSEQCNQYKCQKMVVKHLDCTANHSLKMPCSDDPNTVRCQVRCNKTLDCGHPCPGFCSEPCESMRCMRRVEKIYSPCGHEESLQCFQSKSATCTAPCRRRKSSCKHICKGKCGQDCSKYSCDVAVRKPFRVVIRRRRCFVVTPLMMYDALLHVEQSCHAVTSVLGHVTIVNKGVHMKCAYIHVVDCSFVRTVVKPYAASHVLPVTGNAADVALMENAENSVHNRASRANDHVLGVVLIISAIIFVERNATALDVMPRVPRGCLATTRVLVCVAKTVPLCALFVVDVVTKRIPQDVYN